MFFYLALTIMVIYTLVFFYIDTRDYLNKGGSFGEAMTNMQIPQNISDTQKKGSEQLQKFLDSRPNLKQAIDSGKPDFMKGMTSAMPHLMSAYTKSKPDLDKAQPHLQSAFKKAEPDIKLAQPHLMSAYTKAQPDIKNAFDNSFNDFNEAYQKSRPHLGAEVVELGEKIRGGNSINSNNTQESGVMQQMPPQMLQPTPVTENVMSQNKNNTISRATQSAETPMEMQQFTANNPSFSRLANGHIAKHGKDICPNGCLAPQYDNDMCSNEIFMGKQYRSCPSGLVMDELIILLVTIVALF